MLKYIASLSFCFSSLGFALDSQGSPSSPMVTADYALLHEANVCLLNNDFSEALTSLECVSNLLSYTTHEDAYLLFCFSKIIALDAIGEKQACFEVLRDMAFSTYKAFDLFHDLSSSQSSLSSESYINSLDSPAAFAIFGDWWQQRKMKHAQLTALIQKAPSPEIQAVLFLMAINMQELLFSVL